ncbi:LysM peptidoglycan-binding domain-containing protein [Pseudonocardia sp. KRD-184]|uniref:LysM peptidoglycan-binding domain-containing protein n=1 Tax=Pseudonocardia oceani TaxID=2792013 RepID=A0ABS6U5S1_9PSEU|nr:LysM peptidoglycan-binding domain-containing protein [Pseudonocardia oceani]MBW0091865.1 LysM peptidoglycan-binding domain-containing protein [Pseudonocardia oceani]MBW0098979.1 LysM peptidoglycan-binding domain-containing protein [Pseudonocardia oceani]MBW0111542.1 LysM peptidoglycan-binding domain-containing protein [Pseudonocardia oceani]MBW0122824.1 LysM peptidoglycan-binding domain-containing protein [Pseudonocardia oceani]MBW0127570.1 LysM peptidoglycan-binding domain-containing prote
MSTLSGGSSLAAGQAGITSANGRYTLALQADGDLTVTDGSGAVAWSTGTAGKDVARADMQADGNFVLYTADNGVVWASDTDAPGGVLELQDDRNLVLYKADRTVAWSPNSYISESDKAALDAAEAAGRARAEADAAAAPAPAAERRYTVQRGDSLSKIAKQFYGNGGDYMRIAQANGIANPDLIHPGQDLLIP